MTRVIALSLMVIFVFVSCETTSTFIEKLPKPWSKTEKTTPDEGLNIDDIPEPGIVASYHPLFRDIPLPIKVRENSKLTYTFISDELKMCRLVYSSRHSLNELARFYIDECADLGWILQRDVRSKDAELLFTKPGEKLTVAIEQRKFPPGRILIINLTPDRG